MLRWLVGGLLLATVQSVSAQYIFASVPNIIRAGNTETVAVNVVGAANPIPVSVALKLANGRIISQAEDVMVDSADPRIVELYVDPEVIEADLERAHQAKVVVSCDAPLFNQEKDVLISFEEGYVFIQTDKPIYTPDQRVNIRLFILDQELMSSDQQVKLDILTPQGVIVHRQSDIRVRNGLKAHTFQLPPEPVFGNWTVVASYGAGLKYNRSVNFEVRKYVLPTFSVVLTTPDYILEGTDWVSFEVKATYVYGKPVLGRFYAKVGIVELDGEITIKKKMSGPIENGMADFRLFTEHLGEDWFEEHEGKRLYVEVSVRETASGISENTSDTSTMIVHSPYKFSVGRTAKYFKKGLLFQLKVDLRLVNGKPAKQVDFEVRVFRNGEEEAYITVPKRTDDRGRKSINIRAENADSIRVQLDTRDDSMVRDGVDHNAVKVLDMFPYETPVAGNFLKIIPEDDPTLDGGLLINAGLVSADPVELIYYVVNKGKIEQLGRETNVANGGQFSLDVTYSMVPTFRVVAFFMSGEDVIADSIWIEIPTPACENRLKFTDVGGRDTSRIGPSLPGRNVEFMVTGEPLTTIGLLGVDKAVYLLEDFHRLNSGKMFRTMDSHDTGCGPGGGQTSADIFKNAGVTVLTNARLEVETREGFGCETLQNARRRRSIDDELEAYLARFVGDDEKTFACTRGQKELRVRLSCEERVEQFTGRLSARFPTAGPRKTRRLQRVFMECCEMAVSLRSGGQGGRARTGPGDGGDTSGISDFPTPGNVRSEFPETWIFHDFKISESGEYRLVYTAPSSITEWQITAVGLSDTLPMCIAEPLDILIRKDLFIQLHMPYSIVRKEQVEIIATIFNYRQEDIRVDVAIKTPGEVCTQGTPGVFSANKTVRVEGNNATSVRYVLIGLEEGDFPITVAAFGNVIGSNEQEEDAVERVLRVETEGVRKTIDYSAPLDPQGAGGGQDQIVRIPRFYPLPEDAVPGSERCDVSVIGNTLGPVVTAVVEGLGSLLRQPYGCGEQAMMNLSPNVYVLRYLSSSGTATDAMITKAKSNIEYGITLEQRYLVDDGSFTVFPGYASSSWLTAFVSKVFCHAQEFVESVDEEVICGSMKWLIDNAQRGDGAFVETYRLHHSDMDGRLQGDTAFTAFVLITLHECQCSSLSSRVILSTGNATAFIEGQLNHIDSPYVMAIVSYALALVGSPRKYEANNRLKGMATFHEATKQRYWGPNAVRGDGGTFFNREPPSAGTTETTGYALLAQLALNDLDYSYAIANWLSAQQNFRGGFSSTQDTTIALQALSEYGLRSNEPSVNLDCLVRYDDRVIEFDHISAENALVNQTKQVHDVHTDLSVEASGQGKGKLNVRVSYNSISPNEVDETQCPFKIDTNPQADPRARIGDLGNDEDLGENVYKVYAEIGYRSGPEVKTNMGIVDFGIPSGFEADLDDLELITNTSVYVGRHEISQRSVVFYVDFIPSVDILPTLTLEFKIRRVYPVGNLQPVPIVVYDYYDPTLTCTKFYTLDEDEENRLASICEGEACVCAAGDCLQCDSHPGIDPEVLKDRSCTDSKTYVYKIYIQERKRGVVGFDVFVAEVLRVLKGANDRGIAAQDNLREFWISTSCKTSCGHWPKGGQSFLVIGKTTLEYETEDGQTGIKYILDQSSTLIFWPRDARKRKYRDQFQILEELADDFFTGETSCQ